MNPQRCNWRWIIEGAAVWYEARNHWHAGTIHSLGKNRKEKTVVSIAPEQGGALVSRHVEELYARKPALNGADLPGGNMTLAF